MEIVVNRWSNSHLMGELDNVVQNLKQVFVELDRQEWAQGEKYDLEKAKDKYFEELNELLPKLIEGKNTLYGEYFTKQIQPYMLQK